MSTSNTLTKTDLANILNEIVAIDGTDMTSQEIDDFVDSLNITSINAVDYVVEQGTSGIWTYRKWNSGIAECWGTYTSSNISVASRNGWYSGECTPDNFPTGLFNSVPKMSTNCTTWGTGFHFSFAYSVTSTGCKVGGIRNDLVSSPMTVDIFATGTWK